MASDADHSVALLSLHPRFAERILAGTKRVEFRKTAFKRRVSHIVVYATKPVGAVVGVFRVKFVRSGSPTSIWSEFRDLGGIERSGYRSYYSGHKTAYAIGVDDAVPLEEPILLSELGEGLSPPQSFTYLSAGVLCRLGLALEASTAA